jgi:hypothetical protein
MTTTTPFGIDCGGVGLNPRGRIKQSSFVGVPNMKEKRADMIQEEVDPVLDYSSIVVPCILPSLL